VSKYHFFAARNLREATVTLKFDDLEKIVAVPAGTRLVATFPNIKTAFAGGTTELDIGILDDTDSIVDGVSLATAGLVMPTEAELIQPGYETTAMTDIYVVAGASNTVGEVDVTLMLSFVSDTKLS